MHQVKIASSDGGVWEFRLNGEDTLTITVDGRDYVGVAMPEGSPAKAAVITWSEDGDNRTVYPDGYEAVCPAAPITAVFSGWKPDDHAVLYRAGGTNPDRLRDDPWVEIQGQPVDWQASIFRPASNGCDQCAGSPLPGVIPAMNTPEGVQRCDQCNRYFDDWAAVTALARLVGGVVKFYPAS